MRFRYISLAAMAFIVGCADSPVAPLHPGAANLNTADLPPPPWALISGELITDGEGEVALSLSGADGSAVMSHAGDVATYRGWLLVTPGNQAALLRFTDGGTNVTFSSGAMITKVNGKVSGRGTMTVGGHSYELSAVTEFEANGECATTPWAGPNCASFSAGDGSFSSEASVWTGILSNDGPGSGGPDWDCKRSGCYCVNECVIISDPNLITKGKGR